MALTRCKECDKEVSKKATVCPSCGAPVKRRRSGCAVLIVVLVVLLAIGALISDSDPPGDAAPPQAAVERIDYSVVRAWDIPNGGRGRTIVITQTNANDHDMERLARQLAAESHQERNAFIMVYTSTEAANMRDRVATLSDSESAIYTRHYVGRYHKNSRTGVNEMDIHPEGSEGASRTIRM